MQPNNRAAVALSNEHRRATFERRAAEMNDSGASTARQPCQLTP